MWKKTEGWSDDARAKLTFRDIVTVQQTGVRVNVILWAQKKKKSRVKAAQEKSFVSVRLEQKKKTKRLLIGTFLSRLVDPAQDIKQMVETEELPVRWDVLVQQKNKQRVGFFVTETLTAVQNLYWTRYLEVFIWVSPPGLVPSVRICMLEIRDNSTSKWLSPSRNRYLMFGLKKNKEIKPVGRIMTLWIRLVRSKRDIFIRLYVFCILEVLLWTFIDISINIRSESSNKSKKNTHLPLMR